MTNQSTRIEVSNRGGSGKPSSLALRIRRAAQLATKAKAQATARAGQPAVAADGVAAAATGARPRKNGKASTPGPRGKGAGEAANVFQRYLRSLKVAEVLPPEEEHRLALAYRDSGDSDAAAQLVRGNLRLVVKIAEEYGRSEDQLMDLIQEGNMGLLHALGKFDPDRGVKLSSYAAWWIRAYILKFVLANFRVVRLGTTLAQRKLFYKLRRERERLERSGAEVNVNQLAEALEVRPTDVAEMEMRLASPELSLDTPTRVDSDRPAAGNAVTSDPGERPDVQLETDEFRSRLKACVERFGQGLSGRERQIFAERLVSDQPLTLQELGRRYGVSRERARQLESRLKEKIRLHLEAEFADSQVLREAA
jgi:RNA polymerase sigma-32 factor